MTTAELPITATLNIDAPNVGLGHADPEGVAPHGIASPGVAPPGAAYFDALFADSDDPWRFKTRWYEERKRALTLACLPARRFRSVFEPGCANGELAAALAPRCDRLLATDGSHKAVALAAERLSAWPHAEARQAWLPQDWPAERFELIVVSEVAYYLDAAQLDLFLARVKGALDDGGTVLACHWRHPIDGCTLDGDAVHAACEARLRLTRVAGHMEPDFRIDVWRRNGRSVAQEEGLA
jgi:SAM-dependent methyltransferase